MRDPISDIYVLYFLKRSYIFLEAIFLLISLHVYTFLQDQASANFGNICAGLDVLNFLLGVMVSKTMLKTIWKHMGSSSESHVITMLKIQIEICVNDNMQDTYYFFPLILFVFQNKQTILSSFKPLQRGIAACMTCPNSKVIRSVHALLVKLMSIFPTEASKYYGVTVYATIPQIIFSVSG